MGRGSEVNQEMAFAKKKRSAQSTKITTKELINDSFRRTKNSSPHFSVKGNVCSRLNSNSESDSNKDKHNRWAERGANRGRQTEGK
ncbi:hypothetical protein ILYODFUR_002303, partial [Ilyodon furcidens]